MDFFKFCSLFILISLINCGQCIQEPFNLEILRRFPSFHCQVDYILDKARLTREEVWQIDDIVTDVEAALQDDWPGVKIIPYGSIISGIGLHSSDIDLYVSLPDWARNNTPAYKLVSKTAEILSRYQYNDLFQNVAAKHTYYTNEDVPIVTVLHKKTGQSCDISFNTIAVVDNKLISYLIHTDNRVFKLMFLIKLWGKVLHFPSHVSVILRIFVIFYFQQLDMLPPIYLLQKMSKKNDSVRNWNTSFEEPFYFYYTAQNISLYHLLGGFFQYYDKFDYKNNIVSAFAGYPIQRHIFENVTNIPNIFTSYKWIISKKEQPPLNITSEFCVPQFFVHNFNIGNKINKVMATKIRYSFRTAAKMYAETSEIDFLSLLFNQNLYLENKQVTNKKVTM